LRQRAADIGRAAALTPRCGAFSSRPPRFVGPNEPIQRASAHATIQYAHLIRARFTLGDLLSKTGWLDDAHADDLLDEPGEGPTV